MSSAWSRHTSRARGPPKPAARAPALGRLFPNAWGPLAKRRDAPYVARHFTGELCWPDVGQRCWPDVGQQCWPDVGQSCRRSFIAKSRLDARNAVVVFWGGSRPPKKQQKLSQQRLSQLKNRKGVRSQKDCGKCERSLQEKVDRPLAIDKHCGTQPLSTKVHSEPTEAFVQAGTDNQVSSLGCTWRLLAVETMTTLGGKRSSDHYKILCERKYEDHYY